MLIKGVTLRGIEVFVALASTGSVGQAAALTGLSLPAVSQQLRNLETALGADLVDHAKRPMQLTSAGRSFLVRAERALAELREAQSELTVMDLSHLDQLGIGLIDDFDNDLTPRLATILAESLTGSRLKLVTAPSHEILDRLVAGELQLAVSAGTGAESGDLTVLPLVHDPFILTVPRGTAPPGTDIVAALADLPFLRYAREQLISRQIDTALTEAGLTFESRFEIGSNPALMAMVARGVGWAITTPLGYMRAERFHAEMDVHPLPFGPAARTIALYAGADWAARVPLEIAAAVRALVQSQIVDPALARLPWLAGEFRVLAPDAAPPTRESSR